MQVQTLALPLPQETARALLREVVDQVPRLTVFGYEDLHDPRLSREAQQRGFEESRAAFSADSSLEAFSAALELLVELQPLKSASSDGTSYGLKHLAERWSRRGGRQGTYIPNGVMIAALIALRFPIRFRSGDPNAQYGISRRSLREVERRLRETKVAVQRAGSLQSAPAHP